MWTIQNWRANEQIRISPVRLIDQSDQQVGVVENHEALRMAREAGLDLVEVAPSARPPVCKIMDYGRFKYAQKKNQKKHHEQQLKEVRLRPKTDEHDRRIKLNKAFDFLRDGDKVQFTMQFRGRERFHREVALAIFDGIKAELGERVKIDRPPSMDGKHMIMIVSPVKGAFPGSPADADDAADAATERKPARPAKATAPTEATAAPAEASAPIAEAPTPVAAAPPTAPA